MALASSAVRLIALLIAGVFLAACNGAFESALPKHERPIPERIMKKMETKGMTVGAPILLRIFKEENVLEVWKKDHTSRYALLDTFEICKWSGKLGPKFREGDRQAPEGFYHVNPGLMNPKSEYHLSFNMGFPNSYDRANGRTGSHLMIHGACSSAGCYSMTDQYAEEIYSLAREAFKGGQERFQIQAYPFRMTPENMVRHVGHPHFEFWKMLKEGNDHFEVTGLPPKVDVCEKRYVFNRIADEEGKFKSTAECPASKTSRNLALAFNEKQSKDQKVFDRILTKKVNNPFLKDEDKPPLTSASILAQPTVGVLGLLEPQVVKPASPEIAEASESESLEQKQVDVSSDPFSSELSQYGSDGSGAVPAESTQDNQNIALPPVPEKADRPSAS